MYIVEILATNAREISIINHEYPRYNHEISITNTLEILNQLIKIPSHSVGVFPADHAPKLWTKPTVFVLNCDDRTKANSHWIGIYVDRAGDGFYFDSYGLPRLVKHHINDCKKIVSVIVGIQSNRKVQLQQFVASIALCF